MGGGGLFGMDHQIIDHNSKTALSSTSKLGDFLFLSTRALWITTALSLCLERFLVGLLGRNILS